MQSQCFVHFNENKEQNTDLWILICGFVERKDQPDLTEIRVLRGGSFLRIHTTSPVHIYLILAKLFIFCKLNN